MKPIQHTRTAPPTGTESIRERGAGLVEYALLLALIALVCVSAVTFFGSQTGGSLNRTKDCLAAANGSTPAANCS